jgi:hypothetical protein
MSSARNFIPNPQRVRGVIHVALLFAILLALAPVAGAPQVAAAQERAATAPVAVSADASEEIVYIDSGGVIRVLDTQFSEHEVKWVSPDNGWRDFALGDFNNDGDMEIVAVKGSDSTAFVAVFDPVVTQGQVPAGNVINGIPWKELWRFQMPQRPQTVVAGDFDTGRPGDEFAVIRDSSNAEDPEDDDPTRIVIYKQNSPTGDGTSWEQHFARNFSARWEYANAANWDNAGGDEIVLIDNEDGKIEVYQPDQAFRRVAEVGGSYNKYALLSQYVAGGNKELLNARDVAIDESFQVCNVFVNNDIKPQCVYGLGSVFSRPGTPRFIAAGDINGSGDDEAILLLPRRSPPLMVVRSHGNDGIINEFRNGISFSADDGFDAAAAGDIDGDGKAEIILAGANRILWFPEAHNSASSLSFSVNTNRRSLATGDLDRNGFNAGPQFGASISSIDTTVDFSFTKQGVFSLQNINTEETVPFEIALEGTGYTWLSVFPSSGFAPGKNNAPVEITYNINGAAMMPNQTYNTALIITSSDASVSNQPLRIPVKVVVTLPPLRADPPGATAAYFPCQDPLATQQLTMQITGIPGRRFSALVTDVTAARAAGLTDSVYLGVITDHGTLRLRDAAGRQVEIAYPDAARSLTATDAVTWPSSVPWITAVSSVTNTVPTALTVEVDPTQRTQDWEQAALVLLATSYSEENDIIAQPYWLTLNCASNASFLPLVNRR